MAVTWLTYDFEVRDYDANWRAVGGLYIFSGLNSAGRWEPLYIGQAASLAARLPTHEKWLAAARLGATHVHARVEPQAATRDSIETELIQAYQPRLNVQKK